LSFNVARVETDWVNANRVRPSWHC